ncbi:MAG: homocysteine S-methyltransferase family protein [Eggerthellales bacterium]|nr:homocysteine S-methyltransferase family protein [Eggerthellales bacterium]
MADLQLRFHKDILVLSGNLDSALASYGIDVERDREFTHLFEPETVLEALKMEAMVGAQCIVTNTPGITRARLLHSRLESNATEIAASALDTAHSVEPQHVLAQIGPTLLPIDPDSKTSLKQNRDQYAVAAREFPAERIDAYFLDGMVSLSDLRCALMGVRMVSDLPIIASVPIDAQGRIAGHPGQTFAEAVAIMEELQADVVGFSSIAGPEDLVRVVKETAAQTDLPILAQLEVGEHTKRDLNPGLTPVVITPDNPYKTPDALVDAALLLQEAGVQFFRAVGQSSPSYTGALGIVASLRECKR